MQCNIDGRGTRGEKSVIAVGVRLRLSVSAGGPPPLHAGVAPVGDLALAALVVAPPAPSLRPGAAGVPKGSLTVCFC